MSALNNSLGVALVAIAASQLGAAEDAAHTNRGAAVQKYQAATDLSGTGWPWCAAFVDWCVARLLEQFPALAKQVQRPRTAAAFGLIEWGRSNECIVFVPQEGAAQAGDIAVYNFSHCGIVADFDINRGSFHAIEGNSNADGSRDGYAVVRHARNTPSVRRFIRLPALRKSPPNE